MSETNTTPKKKLTTTQVILIVGIIVVLMAVVGVGVFLFSKMNQPAAPALATPGTGNLVVDDNFDPNAMIEKAAENMFEVKMNSDWFFPDGTSPAEGSYIANSTANHASFYVDVVIKDTEEIIYTSPLIGLGSAVRDFTLTKDLDAGDYECICRFNLLADDGTVSDVVSVSAVVHVAA